ncbi:MAG TPA: efflux transporter outer membrane subunit [Myxococcota bacterium]|nr:efflux transporter outer membrane subunit [Myxococcota bacterium]
MRLRRALTAPIALVLAAACAVGPDYVPTEVSPPPEFRSQVTPTDAASIADLPWWEVFDDPVLQQLVAEALGANYDLATAVYRVEQAKAQVGVAQSPFYPQIVYQGNAGRQRQPDFLIQPAATFDLFYGAFSLAWELDVWGRIRRSNEAAQQQLLGTEDVRRGVMLSLVTEVAGSYLTLLELDRELEITQENVKSFDDSLDLFSRRFKGGVGNRLQVARAEAAQAQVAAQIPNLRRQITEQENALSVLLGRAPGPIARGVPFLDRPPAPPTPPGLPSALLERRPDVLQAESTVASSNALVGVAVANFFPQIGLTGVYGAQSIELHDLVKSNFNLWNYAGNVAGPLFQGFALLEQYRGQKADWEQTKAQYKQTVITAFAEVSTALSAQAELGAAREAQERSVLAYQESVKIARIRFDQGLANYYEVLEAQQQLFPAQIVLARFQLDQLLTVVTLYRALGGGWKLTDEQWTQKPP